MSEIGEKQEPEQSKTLVVGVGENIIGALIFAWFLTWFSMDKILIEGVKNLFNFNLTTSGYYLFFFMGAILLTIIEIIYKRKGIKFTW